MSTELAQIKSPDKNHVNSPGTKSPLKISSSIKNNTQFSTLFRKQAVRVEGDV